MTGLLRRSDTSSAVSFGLFFVTLGLIRASLERVEHGLSPATGTFSFILRGVRACLEGDTSVSFSRIFVSLADLFVFPGVTSSLLGVSLLTVFLFDRGVLSKDSGFSIGCNNLLDLVGLLLSSDTSSTFTGVTAFPALELRVFLTGKSSLA